MTEPTGSDAVLGGATSFDGMRWIAGGDFLMGSNEFYPEERPVHRVAVDGFWIDEHPVTVADFGGFVRETGYVTVAERPLDSAQYPDADPDLLVPGSLLFRRRRRLAGRFGSLDLRGPPLGRALAGEPRALRSTELCGGGGVG